MRIVFLSYKDINNSTRDLDIIKIIEKISDYYAVISPYKYYGDKCSKAIMTKGGYLKQLYFLSEARNTMREIRPDIVFLSNNQTIRLIPWIQKELPNCRIVYDSAELYIDGIPKGVKGKIALYMRADEMKYMRRADIVFAANQERADIMEKHFRLRRKPFVLDNIHRITDEFDLAACEQKYGQLFYCNRFVVFYSGGVLAQRMTIKLAEAVYKLGNNYSLIVVGGSTTNDLKKFEQIRKNGAENRIFYLGKVSLSELRYLLSRCDLSAALYMQDTTNNKYCASGKVYEGMFEGKPVLASTNPPLARLCEEENVGISTDNLCEGILCIERNYIHYAENVCRFISTIDSEKRISDAVNNIRSIIQ